MAVARRIATHDDLLRALDAGLACELIGGELMEKAAPDQEHGAASVSVIQVLGPPYNRRGGGGRPGGWWIRAEVEIRIGDAVLRPDLSGWRRDRVPAMPTEWPVPIAPDWVCEVLSASTAARDLGPKRDLYAGAGVGHYWVVDRANRLLLVYRHTPEGYVLTLSAAETETVRAPPFVEVPFFIGQLFGIDPPEDE